MSGAYDERLFACYAIGAGFLLAAVWVLARRRSRPQSVPLVFLLCVLGVGWSALSAGRDLGRLGGLSLEFLAHIPFYAVYLDAVLLLMLTRTLFGMPAGWAAAVLGFAWGALSLGMEAGVLPIPGAPALPGGLRLDRAGLVALLLAGGWAAFMIATTVLTVQTVRRRSRFYTLGAYWALTLIGAAVSGALVWAGYELPGCLAALATALAAVYVVTTRRLSGIEFTLRRLFGYLVFTGAAVALYTAVLTGLQLLYPGWKQLSPLAGSLAAALALTALLAPALIRLQKWTRRSLMHSRVDSAETLRHYSQSITNILDMDRLATVAVGAASQTLDVRQGFLFLVDQEQAAAEDGRVHLRGVKGMGNEAPADGSFAPDGALAGWFRDAGKPLTQVEIDTQPLFHDLPKGERRWLDELGAEVYLPIYAKNEWIGLLTLGPKGSGAEYTTRDLALLSTLADQTAVALENIRLVEGLMRLNNEFRRAYTALDQANQRLERLDKTKSDFISIASHELRTPLTLINGASQMLLEDPDLGQNAYHQQLLQKIKTGGDRLHEILETMLDVAKIDLRTMDLEPQPVTMASLIQGVCADLNKDAAARKQILTSDVPQDLPVVMADMLALRKVFYHLILNAIKYTPDDGRITISGKRLEPNVSDLPHGGVEIIVADTGIGIDPRFQELIFVKFYQTGELALHSTGRTKFKGGGPGLGLAIARGIVEAHHGRIWVESPGYDEQNCPGSQFHVVLPIRPGDRPAPPSAMIFDRKS